MILGPRGSERRAAARALLVVSVVLSACSNRSDDRSAKALSRDLSELFVRVAPSVVTLVPDGAGPELEHAGVGSGFALRGGKYVVTAGHVVEGYPGFRVSYADGTSTAVRIHELDRAHDLALLVPAAGDGAFRAPGLELEHSAPPRVGELVVAVGDPFGLKNSMSLGMVSGLERTRAEAHILVPGIDDAARFIQTDAVLHPGNSGGPLLNLSGRVVGIAIATYGTTQRIGFAAPVSAIDGALRAAERK